VDLLTSQAISALGGSLTQGGDFRMYIGFNPGAEGTKDGSFGGSFVIKGGATDAQAEMIDINGDNLPDKVFRDGGHVSFRLNASGPVGTTTFGPTHQVGNLDKLSNETSFEAAGGPDVNFGVTAAARTSLWPTTPSARSCAIRRS
jgi:hypothetical protein